MSEPNPELAPARPLRRHSRILRRSRHVLWSRSRWGQRVVFIVGALAVGLVSVGFASAAGWANRVVHLTIAHWWWAPLIATPLGLALVRYLTDRWFAGSQGSGIPQTIAALRLDDEQCARLLSLKVASGKILLTVLGLLVGASIGREGPSVQIGAAIMLALSRLVSFPHIGMRRGLVLAGGAAGVAAAFNAPLAGVVFAIEEMSRTFEQRTAGIVVTAVVVSGIVALGLQGNSPYFGQARVEIDGWSSISAVILCSIAGGVLGGAFSRMMLSIAKKLPPRLESLRSARPVAFAALCGLVLAAIGLASGNTTLGTGYDETRSILEGHAITHGFGIMKFAATLVSYVSGIPGGIFAPSLAVGAGLGSNLAVLLPATPLAAVVLLAMVGYFSGVVQAPLTAFVIVLEMTRETSMTIPLMATSLIAYGIARMICPVPLYKGLAKGFLGVPRESGAP